MSSGEGSLHGNLFQLRDYEGHILDLSAAEQRTKHTKIRDMIDAEIGRVATGYYQQEHVCTHVHAKKIAADIEGIDIAAGTGGNPDDDIEDHIVDRDRERTDCFDGD